MMRQADAMDETALRWWTDAAEECRTCGGQGLPVVLDAIDEETREAVRTGLAALGGCGLGGSAFDRECLRCGARWSAGS